MRRMKRKRRNNHHEVILAFSLTCVKYIIAEYLIRGAVEKLADSRRHFKSKLVADARELLELVLTEYGTMKPQDHHESTEDRG